MNSNNRKNVLIIRPGSLGDIIATIPVFLSLKHASFNVYLIGRENVNRYLEYKGIIKKGIDFNDIRLVDYFHETKKLDIPGFPNFELVLCYIEPECKFSQNLVLTYGNKIIFHPVSEHISIHITDFLLAPLKQYGIKTFCYVPTTKKIKRNIFFIHPGSGSEKKNWPRENFAEVFKTMNKNFECKIL
ncbi:MAG TPA: hypothetical protein PKW86_09825, partial [bacterium]|nr:hypothetical protein [bacterium]